MHNHMVEIAFQLAGQKDSTLLLQWQIEEV